MPGAIRSTVDASILHAMRARRLATERHADEKLRILRRLRRRYDTKSLPKETSAESSFIEQLFAKLFDYSTLLSHETAAYQLHAKPYVPGGPHATGSYPDFSLGHYVPGIELILASAELKGPNADLDAPQGGNYDGLSPVQQAFRAVNSTSSCRWVIVSNLVELRLYRWQALPRDSATPPSPIAVVNLRDVSDRHDLAQLCAHFDRRALLGTTTDASGDLRSELMAALEHRHPATPLDAKSDHMRAVLLFTPRATDDLPLFLIERRLRGAVMKSSAVSLFFGPKTGTTRFELANGCIIALGEEQPDGTRCKVTMSGEGQIQLSVSRSLAAGRTIPATWLVDVVRFFAGIVDSVFDELADAAFKGRVSSELREVDGVTLKVDASLAELGIPAEGMASGDVMGADFVYTPIHNAQDALVADVASELAIYFRTTEGGVGLDRNKLRNTSA